MVLFLVIYYRCSEIKAAGVVADDDVVNKCFLVGLSAALWMAIVLMMDFVLMIDLYVDGCDDVDVEGC